MNRKIIQIVFVVAFCVLFTSCYRCYVRRPKNITIDRENYNSVKTVENYFTVLWEDRGFIDDYQGTVKVYGWVHWRGEKYISLHHGEGGSPVIGLRFDLSDEEIRPLVDTTTFGGNCYIEGEITYEKFFGRTGNCVTASPVIIVNSPNDIYFE